MGCGPTMMSSSGRTSVMFSGAVRGTRLRGTSGASAASSMARASPRSSPQAPPLVELSPSRRARRRGMCSRKVSGGSQSGATAITESSRTWAASRRSPARPG